VRIVVREGLHTGVEKACVKRVPALGQGVDVGDVEGLAAVRPEDLFAQVVGHDEHDVRTGGGRVRRGHIAGLSRGRAERRSVEKHEDSEETAQKRGKGVAGIVHSSRSAC
jgi:hypothetical protein